MKEFIIGLLVSLLVAFPLLQGSAQTPPDQGGISTMAFFEHGIEY